MRARYEFRITGRRGLGIGALGLLMALVVVAVITLAARQVSAHAEPVSAEPPIDGTVATAPAMVRVVFGEELAAEGSALAVIGPDGTAVDNGDSTLDLNDMSRKTLKVTLKPGLGDGLYTVQWTTASNDGHTEQGSFTFTVGQATDACATPAAGTPEAGTPEASPDIDLMASPEATPDACATPVAAIRGSLGSSGTSGPIGGWSLLYVAAGVMMVAMIGTGRRFRLAAHSSAGVHSA